MVINSQLAPKSNKKHFLSNSRKWFFTLLAFFAFLLFASTFVNQAFARESFCSAEFYNSDSFKPENKIDKLIVRKDADAAGMGTAVETSTVLNADKLYVAFPAQANKTISDFKVEVYTLTTAVLPSSIWSWVWVDPPNIFSDSYSKETIINGNRYFYVEIYDFNRNPSRWTADGYNWIKLIRRLLNEGKTLDFRGNWNDTPCGEISSLPIVEDIKKEFSANCKLAIAYCSKGSNKYNVWYTVNHYNFKLDQQYVIGLDEGLWTRARGDLATYNPTIPSASIGFGPVELELSPGQHNFCVDQNSYFTPKDSCVTAICTGSIKAGAEIKTCDGTEGPPNPDEVETKPGAAFNLCAQIPIDAMSGNITSRQACCECAGGDLTGGSCTISADQKAKSGLWTAIGCVRTDQEGIIKHILRVGLMISGGFALLVILISSFMLSTSQGDPKRTGEAKEQLTAAIMGLIFIIFSITILRFIGVDILRLPGFGG